MTLPYDKPFLSVPEQVATLQSRGLGIRDVRAAEAHLQTFNYYRLRGYCYRFEASHHPEHRFAPGIEFDHLTALCAFDESLTLLLSRALRWAETGFRTRLAYRLAEAHGSAFPHLDGTMFDPRQLSRWQETLKTLCSEAQRKAGSESADPRIRHLATRYSQFPHLPIWAAVEISSMGTLSRLYAELSWQSQKRVSEAYGLPPALLKSWLHHLVQVRNQCAHHGRVWDTSFPAAAKPHQEWEPRPRPESLFSSMLCLNHLIVSQDPFLAQRWRGDLFDCLRSYLASCPLASEFAASMGLSEDWPGHPGWSPAGS